MIDRKPYFDWNKNEIAARTVSTNCVSLLREYLKFPVCEQMFEKVFRIENSCSTIPIPILL